MGRKQEKRERRYVARKENIAHFKETLLELGFSSYREYLQSDLWKGIRERVYQRDNYTCRICKKPSQVAHHRSYHDSAMLGKDISMIISLCHGCHKRVEFRTTDGGKRSDYAADIICRSLTKTLTPKQVKEFNKLVRKKEIQDERRKQIQDKIAAMPKEDKWCPQCKKTKTVDHFIVKYKGVLKSWCLECRTLHQRKSSQGRQLKSLKEKEDFEKWLEG